MKKILIWIGFGILIIAAKSIYGYVLENNLSNTSIADNEINELANIYENAIEDGVIDDKELEDITEELKSSNAIQMLDDLLLEGGMVDSNYRYIDLPRLELYFKNRTTDVQKTLPVEVNGVTTTKINLTPYMHTYYYTFNENLSSEQMEAFRDNEELFVQEFCGLLFATNHQRVNNTEVKVFMHDLSENFIFLSYLNNHTCS